jgi:hypothetical protein
MVMMNAEIIAAITAAVLLAIGSIGVYVIDRHKCISKSEMMSFNHNFSIITGCMIEYESGKWIEMDKYRAVD